jgi:radical SAM superfamily enzyme YgiQ (UPF0313 family)
LKGVIDYFFVGDAEESLPLFLDRYTEGGDLSAVEGVFTGGETMAKQSPLEYHPVYQPIQWGEYTEAFPRSFLLEMSRGCSRKCKYCLVSHCVGRKRERSVNQIQSIMERAEKYSKFETVVLIGPDSHSDIIEVIETCRPYRVSLPSLRVEQISEELLGAVKPETVTIAPETSERLRFTLGKTITDEDIFEKAGIVSEYSKRLKLYFMVGLPGETEDDLKKMVDLVKAVRKVIRTKVTVSPFVPKPHTPFSDVPYNITLVEKALQFLRKYMRISGPSAKQGFIQWALSVGDERVTDFLQKKRYATWKSLEHVTFKKDWELINI